jgi:hypothetical protein
VTIESNAANRSACLVRPGRRLWTKRSLLPGPALLALAVLLLTAGFSGTGASATARTRNPGNVFATKADWTPPTTSAAKVLNNIGYVDVIRPGGGYQVCASAVDNGGNPPSGMASAAANLAVAGNVITTGATATSLTTGSFSCAGTTYGYQSASLVADGGISGSKSFSVSATDLAGNAATTTWSVQVDNTSPSLTALVTTNVGGGVQGRIDAGDSFSVTMTEPTIDLPRIISGWNGASIAVFLRVFNNNAAFGGNDVIVVCKSMADCQATAAGADNILGTVNLGAIPFVAVTSTFNGTLIWDPATRVFRATFGSCASSPCTTVGKLTSSTATFVPMNGATRIGGIRDTAGNGATGSAAYTGLQF